MKKSQISLVLASVLMAVGVAAEAAIPTGAATAVTGLQTDMQAWFDLIFPAILLGVTLSVGPKLFKRFTSKI